MPKKGVTFLILLKGMLCPTEKMLILPENILPENILFFEKVVVPL